MNDTMRGAATEGQLLGHLLRFARLLRLMGVRVTLSQLLELLRALDHLSLAQRRDFFFAARALLVTRHEDFPLFEQAFQLYWRLPEPLDLAARSTTKRALRPRLARLPGLNVALLAEEGEPEADGTPSYSALEQLRRKDFAQMSWEELDATKAAIAALRWPVTERPTRRLRPAPHGPRLDLRRLTRDNLRYGGEPLRLRWRERRTRRRPLVVLCDISGSMERYARMLVHFAHALSHRLGTVESFLFGTRLTRITHHLRHRDVDDALDEVGKMVEDWAGGTRIGESLKLFNFRWARRVLGRGAVVLIISDGWDRGDSTLLAHEMARLQRATHRLIWLNPLLGAARYEPVQRGMAAALPFVDDFLPVHNLASLAQLAEHLSRLGEARPARRQARPAARQR